jgi:methionyl-tRNA synthetase
VLFRKLEDERIAELRERYSGSQAERAEAVKADAPAPEAAPAPQTPEEIARAFAAAIDLRVAQIVKIERHPKADKLYIETLEIAGEERTIVSGLVPFYKEEELLGKRIIVAYNLKAAKLRGVESRGMLLAASDRLGPPGETGEPGERVEVLDAGDAPTGTRVVLDGLEAPAPEGGLPADGLPEISIDKFFACPLEVKDHIVRCGGRAFTLNGKPVTTVKIAAGEVH